LKIEKRNFSGEQDREIAGDRLENGKPIDLSSRRRTRRIPQALRQPRPGVGGDDENGNQFGREKDAGQETV
jgi:hypothetical protein